MMHQEVFSLLVSQTIQVTLLALIVWIAARWLAHDRPHLAHALWVVVLIKCVTPPVWHSPVSPFNWLAFDSPAAAIRPTKQPPLVASVAHAVAAPVNRQDPTISQRTWSGSTGPRLLDLATTTERPQLSGTIERPMPVTTNWRRWAVAAWAMSAMLVLLLNLFRFGRFLVWLRGSPAAQYPELEREVLRLAGRLKIRRRVRLRVLQAPVGPAVLGWIRPTILLPEAIVAGKTQSQLEPLLAHELVHVRRGDLGWACVQTMAKSLFWFHPLIRLAVSMVTRESERSCDEETVASLNCTPADYARGLLEVLEHKHRLRVAPALPGVRPLDITSARLERVMKLGQGSCRRTPVWIWLVMLIGGAAVLPGASMIVAQEESKQAENAVFDSPKSAEGHWTKLPIKQKPELGNGVRLPLASQSRDLMVIPSSDENEQPWMLKSFDVSGILKKIRAANLESGSPKQRLIQEFPCRVPGQQEQSTPLGRDIRFVDESGDGEIHLGGTEPTIKIRKGTMYVFDTADVVDEIERNVARLNKFGFKQVEVECQFGTIPRDGLDDLGVRWSIGYSAVAPLTNPPNDGTDAVVNANYLDAKRFPVGARDAQQLQRSPVRAASFVEKSSPVLYALVDDEEHAELLKRFKDAPDTSLAFAPRVRMLNGQSAQVSTGSIRPFVVGLNRTKDADGNDSEQMQPVIRLVSDGSTFNLNAVSNDDHSVDLDCQLSLSKVLSVDTTEVPVATGNGKATIQIPEVATSQIHSSMRIPKGKTLVLGSFRDAEDGKKEAFLAILKCQSIDGIREIPVSRENPDSLTPERLPADESGPYQKNQPDESSRLEIEKDVRYLTPTNDPANPWRLVNLSERMEALQGSAADADEPTEAEERNATPSRLLVRAANRSSVPADYQPLHEKLRQHSIDIRVEGGVDFEIKDDRVLLSGPKFWFGRDRDVGSGEASFQVAGDRGQLEIIFADDSARIEVKLTGGASLLEAGFESSADQIDYAEGLKLELRGNATAATDKFKIRAQRVRFDNGEDGITLLEGDAQLIRGSSKSTEIRADRIEWNMISDEISSSGLGSLEISK